MYRGHAGLSLLLFSPFIFVFRAIGADVGFVVLTCFLVVVFSFVPDFDIVFTIAGYEMKHRGITHTLLFGLVVGALLSFVQGIVFGSLGWFMGFVAGFGGTASHLLGDALTSGQPRIKPFYPFSEGEVAFGFFKASDRGANNTILALGVLASAVSYVILVFL